MKFNKQTLIINSFIFVVLSLFAGISGGGRAAIGIVAFLLGVVDLGIGFVLVLARKRDAGLTLLIYAGILLLIGFSVCSTVTMDFK